MTLNKLLTGTLVMELFSVKHLFKYYDLRQIKLLNGTSNVHEQTLPANFRK